MNVLGAYTAPDRVAGLHRAGLRANAALVAERILRSVDLLATQPEMGRPGRVVGPRELVVPATGLVIPYRVRKGCLELIAVFHGRQR